MDINEKYKSSRITGIAGMFIMTLALIQPLFISYNELAGLRWSYGVDNKANMLVFLVGFVFLIISGYLSKRGK